MTEQGRLTEYYKQLDPVAVQHEVELMKDATTEELYQLIANDCRHYIAILENYREENVNLQTLFNLSIKRIEGHLVIKFKLHAIDRWTEVGFLDDNNTEQETLTALRTMINFQLKDTETHNLDRREHLAAQLEEEQAPSVAPSVAPAVPPKKPDEPLFDGFKISSQQRKSAGYKEVPEHLKAVEQQLRKPSQGTFNISERTERTEGAPKQFNEPPVEHDRLKEHLMDHQRLKSQLERIVASMSNLPQSCIYKYTAELLGQYDPIIVAGVILECLRMNK